MFNGNGLFSKKEDLLRKDPKTNAPGPAAAPATGCGRPSPTSERCSTPPGWSPHTSSGTTGAASWGGGSPPGSRTGAAASC